MRKYLAVALAAVFVLGMVGTASANDDDDNDGPHGCGPFVNTILGSSGPDVLNGTFCDDRILGFGDNDVLRGKGGVDNLRGGRGNDRLNGVETLGPPRADRLNGGRGFFDVCVIDFLDTAVNCESVIEVDIL